MRSISVRLLVLVVLAALPVAAQTDRTTAAGRNINLAMPKSISENDKVVLEVKIGALPRGAELEINTSDGRFLGVISPFGVSSVESIYTIPVPPDLTTRKSLELRFTFGGPIYSRRAPTKRDIRNAKIKVAHGNTGTTFPKGSE